MQVGARKQHLHLAASRPLTARPPSTPDEIDDPKADVWQALGLIVGGFCLVLLIGLLVTVVFSLAPVTP